MTLLLLRVSARYYLRGIIIDHMLTIDTYICWKEQLVKRDDRALSSMTVDNIIVLYTNITGPFAAKYMH